MPELLLSIIIPIYKIEEFISECIDSIEHQIEEGDCLEIICVDDGSPDRSGEIVQQLAEKYKNIVYLHKENGGVSTARNYGIDIAKGKYIWFIDGDDLIVDGVLQVILQALKANTKEMPLLLALSSTTSGGKFKIKRRKYNAPAAPWLVITPSKVLRNNKFEEELAYGEDYYWTFLLGEYFEECQALSPGGYYYRQREGSAMNNNTKAGTAKRIDSFQALYKKYDVLEKQKCLKKRNHRQLKRRKAQCVQACLLSLLQSPFSREEIEEYIQQMRENGIYPHHYVWSNLNPKKNFMEWKSNLVSFLLPKERYFWFLYKLMKKGRRHE